MAKQIYLDNSSTTFPKAPGVSEAVRFFMDEVVCNINRGGYENAYQAATVVIETRALLARMFHAESARNIVFTSGATQALNMIVKGLLHSGDHVLVSSMEHNAMMRPLVHMERYGITFSRIPGDEAGQLSLAAVERMIQPNTKAIMVQHASNICGALTPLIELGAVARAYQLFFITDAAQTAGVFDLDMQAMGLDAIVFTGHKGLLGPQGTGGIALSNRLAESMEPLMDGGTGSLSDKEETPGFLPDKFEPGTMNIPGIYGLHAALMYLDKTGIASLRTHEQRMSRRLYDGLRSCPGTHIPGPADFSKRAGIVSVDFCGYDNGEIATFLSEKHGVFTRCGLHCAPNAHKTLGTFPQGMVRFSPGFRTTETDVDEALDAVYTALSQNVGLLR